MLNLMLSTIEVEQRTFEVYSSDGYGEGDSEAEFALGPGVEVLQA